VILAPFAKVNVHALMLKLENGAKITEKRHTQVHVRDGGVHHLHIT